MARKDEEEDGQGGLPALSGSMAEHVASGNAVIKYQTETMMRVAIERPRNVKACLQAALDEVEAIPEEAENNWYAIPHRDHEMGCPKPRNRKGELTCNCPEEFIEGPSINAATTLARCWGNCLGRVRFDDDTDSFVRLSGVFIDFQQNVTFEAPTMVSKLYRARGGNVVRLAEKTLEKAIGAGSSKALRNAILKGIPKPIIAKYIKTAKEVWERHQKDQGMTLAARIEKMVPAFAGFGVTEKQLAGYLKHPIGKCSAEELATLQGIYNAIKLKEQTAAEIFGGGGEPAGEDEPPTITAEKVVATAEDATPKQEKRQEPKKPEQVTFGSDW